ncbi:hypothetical protein ABS767_11975 [Sphingomonas sp. ST-64]|uniref:Acetyltransferase (GNAT) domain-containing protein n=1 Tax=Sphingomonas plantiphila TaxID=3163295 RepID=A0ABW8YRH7_9SPHN
MAFNWRIARAIWQPELDLVFRPSRAFLVEVSGSPGMWMAPGRLEQLQRDCRTVVAACLNGDQLDYGLFEADGKAWNTSVITLVRDAADRRPIAFNAMPLLPVRQGAEQIEVLHLGLVMVDPSARSAGLSWLLYGLTCFFLFLRHRLRPLWISSVTQVPAVVGMVAETFDQVWPGQDGTLPSFAHRHFARQIMASHRHAFGVGQDAGYDAVRSVITDAYTGGSDNLKKSFAVAAKHRDPRYNRFCETLLDYARGDDVLQIGQLNFATLRRFLLKSVPRSALPRLIVQLAVIATQAAVAPVLQWLAADRSLGQLRPAR